MENISKDNGKTEGDDRPNSYSDAKRMLAEEEKGFLAFFKFHKPVRYFIAGGLALGIIFAAGVEFIDKKYAYLIIPYPVLSFVLLMIKEIGLGLIVAAVAVFGYEYSHKVRGEYKRQLELEGTLNQLETAVDAVKKADDVLTLNANDYRKAGDRILSLIFPDNTPAEKRFKESIKNIIIEAWYLKRANTIYSESYLDFLGWLCKNTVETNTVALSKLENSAKDPTKRTPWAFSLPTTETVAGKMLCSQLSCLQNGDSYQTISNVLFWERQDFSGFWKETENACNRGVKVERLFYLKNLIENENLLETKFETAQRIIIAHKELEKKTGGKYEVRFLTKIQAKKSLKNLDGKQDLVTNLNLYSFGIFRHGKDTDVVSFVVERQQFSRIKFSRNEVDVDDYQKAFDEMWKNSEGVKNPFYEDIEKPFDSNIEYFKRIVNQEV